MNSGHADALNTTENVPARLAPCACGALVELHQVRPMVTTDGSVRYRCSDCASGQPRPAHVPAQPQPEAIAEPAAGSTHKPASQSYWRLGVLAAAVALVTVAATRSRTAPAPAAVASFFAPSAYAAGEYWERSSQPIAGQEPTRKREVIIEDSDDINLLGDPDVPTIEDVLESSDESLEERLPTLADWVHPVPGSSESFPLKSSRRFGAHRDGVSRQECDRGHCGVDLGGPRGTPIVAVAWGTVARVRRSSRGRSGKYVRIEHPDFVYTSYMHLDSIPRDLRVGDEVQPGDVIGTLGRTGILYSAPHLHFSVEIPREDSLEYLDPAPYLRRATRHAEVPQMPAMMDTADQADSDSELADEFTDASDELPAD